MNFVDVCIASFKILQKSITKNFLKLFLKLATYIYSIKAKINVELKSDCQTAIYKRIFNKLQVPET